MVTKYKFVNYEFNFDLWAATIKGEIERNGVQVMSELLDTSESILINWAKGRWTEDFKYPNMTNFLKVCNLLETQPLQFFTTSE
jgi:hypothetical protein